MKQPIVVEKFADNGEHSRWELMDVETGEILWSEDETVQIKKVIRGRIGERGVVIIGCGDNKESTMRAIHEAGLAFHHTPIVGVVDDLPKFPERPPVEMLIHKLPDLQDTFYDEPKHKGHERPFKYHR